MKLKEKSSNEKYTIIYNKDGSFNRIRINENIFINKKGKSIENIVKEYLKKHIGEYVNIIESGQRVYLGNDLPGEYAYSKSMQALSINKKYAKGYAAIGIKGLIQNAKNRKYESNKKNKHKIDAKYGFYKYDIEFSIEYKENEKIYSGNIVIRNDTNGKKYLYDIINIKNR